MISAPTIQPPLQLQSGGEGSYRCQQRTLRRAKVRRISEFSGSPGLLRNMCMSIDRNMLPTGRMLQVEKSDLLLRWLKQTRPLHQSLRMSPRHDGLQHFAKTAEWWTCSCVRVPVEPLQGMSYAFADTRALAIASTVSSQELIGREADADDVVLAVAKPSGDKIEATFKFTKTADGKGLQLSINATGLDKGAEYPFHVHVDPVPKDGNCTATGGHLDPYGVKAAAGDKYKCSKTNILKTCELGDLAGIFGNMVGDDKGNASGDFVATELAFGTKNTILDHSIVIHNSDGDRVACANIDAFVLDEKNTDELVEAAGAQKSEDGDDTGDASSVVAKASGLLVSLVVAALI
ncbi:Cu,Zn superoxide dismutase-like protein [Coemansia reversa NRRL 1564]|uniref:Cu,Zn superoxide dismutase-like protein n=1 Tax=Coemansia reversa (strain ATCC 12441 / NRRL 1564) TaxID=763665 RepID=A0A2G5BKZ8_COERN|nr:Cu,Zn superoxide dismutase-like protein [Coemansia reversa NRRL 1564]|eukprot:PIA19437.1 Cu,Zn superoxide dismutase-like protein [Coemansia reversa NRRL 1564]